MTLRLPSERQVRLRSPTVPRTILQESHHAPLCTSRSLSSTPVLQRIREAQLPGNSGYSCSQQIYDVSSLGTSGSLRTSVSQKNETLPTIGSSLNNTQLTQSQIPDDSDFKRIVFNEMSLLNLKINTALEKIDSLIRAKRTETEPEGLQQLPQILYLIPLKNDQDFEHMEDWLKEGTNQRILIKELSRIGGSSINQVTRKIMYRTLSNEVGMEYSWEGAKKKKPFKNLALAAVILESVRLCFANATECEIITIIKLWLVRSKDRYLNANKGNKENEENHSGHEDLNVERDIIEGAG
ncbi:hypothetical protein NQ314_007759 [Rhamnusium bicolor]|uniref:DUF4806 domain-containing protein n=1 Tax=Rhamnusium bicolor TaxID=1586634 RepID=A0AAV8YK48_9CUCU|nr:hypothetical protein NQ314_007759 [Rhamnusium bicolor]